MYHTNMLLRVCKVWDCMLLEWTQRAEDELVEAVSYYLEQEDYTTAHNIASRIIAATARLATLPHSGRKGLIPGTRELIVPRLPFIIVYEVTQHVLVLRVLHTSRLWE